MIDTGTGSPIVLIPGVQGRWEWMSPAIDALSRQHRVLSFSLGASADTSFDGWLHTIDALLDAAAEHKAGIVGVSFGGLIAARYAAHRPERVSSLVLVSAPSPRWQPTRRDRVLLQHPRLAQPAFIARGCVRMVPEILAAKDTWRERVRFGWDYARRVLNAPISPSQMAHWIRQWLATDIVADCKNIATPTLLMTGEPGLDRVVPVSSTLDYLGLIRGARHTVLPRTGHVGLVSKPAEFAALIHAFIEAPYARAS